MLIEQILQHGGYQLGKKQKGSIYEIDRCPSCGKKHKAYVDIEKDCAWCFSCNLASITADTGNVGWVKMGAYIFFDEYDANPRDKDTQKRIFKELDLSTGFEHRSPVIMPEEKPKVETASLKTRDDTYRFFLSCLGLTQAHEAHLREIRGMSTLDIAELFFRSMPSAGQSRVIVKKLLSSGYSLKGVPGFYKDNGKWVFNAFHQGILLPVLSPDGLIQGFQVKKDKPDPKYVFLSSGSDFMENGSCAESWTHCLNIKNAQHIFITEGVLKGDVLYAQMRKQIGVIAIPGIHSIKHLDAAIRSCRRDANFYLCLDMDKITNIHVIEAEKEIVKHLAVQNRMVKIVRWPEELKGIDDYLLV